MSLRVSDSEPTFASAGTWEEGKCCSVQPDCSPGRSSYQSPSPSRRPPHRGHAGQLSADPTGGQAGGLVRAAQAVPVVDLDGTSRLRDSVRQTPAQIQGHPFHFCPLGHGCLCPACGDCSLTGERRNRACPSSRDEVGVLQPLLHRAQEERWVTTNPGHSSLESVPSQAAVQNAHFETYPFVRSTPGLVCGHRPEGRVLSRLDFASTQTFLRFAFEGRAYQYKVLPFGLSLSPRVFTKFVDGALNPLWRKGIRILNYLDDWLIMAHSRDQLCEHRDLVLQHLSHLGLRVNREKSKLSPVHRISFLGMELDSINMTACLTNERTQSVLNCLKSFRHKTAVPLKTFQRLLGHMAAAAAVTPLGLLHMRPLQRWLHDRVPRWAWHRGTLRIGVSPQCRRLFSPWSDPAYLRAGVPLGQVSRHVVVHTDASSTGWGAVCNGQAASGSWTGPRLLWHINCLELLAVLLALRRFLPMLRHKHVLVRTDNTATVAYINHQGGLRSRRMSQLARHLLLWSQTRLKSLRAVHIPGELNRAADQLSRQPTHPGEWRLHPQTVQLIWSRFGEAQIDLFASPESSHCQLYYSLSEAPLGRDALAHSWPPGPKYAFPPVSLLGKIREDGEQVLLVAPYWPTRTWFVDLTLLATAPPWKIPLRKDLLSQGMGIIWHPRPDLWNLHCASRWEDPQRCPIAVVLSFLQEKLERRLSPSTLKVYVAAIAAYHDAVDGESIGKHQLVVRFLRGARRVNPPRPHLIPSWDLSVALRGLQGPPFKPLVSVELKFLSLKTALLTALASIKRVGDLQAFSVNEACLEFGPADSHIILRPRPGYVPKVPTTPFRDQVVNLQALPPEEADPALALLCPVCALRVYVDRTWSFRHSEQLFVCFGGQQKENAVSKQRLAHWVVDAISLAYESQGEPCPLGVRAHSTRSVASSYALAHGASLADICRAAGWATPNTFARFYNLRVEPLSSRVLR
ncbi:ORF V: Enzymatic polyprotein [Labeo rohita]|uniref:ribonuclease H n=1 Tax=Labeo rohita TaxID=84645 RepID=A0ABQ8LII0_LABRO|nr:ORF V: Enzymatic polyprotein [Labeo rohita]